MGGPIAARDASSLIGASLRDGSMGVAFYQPWRSRRGSAGARSTTARVLLAPSMGAVLNVITPSRSPWRRARSG
eukprot:9317946-Pyramimonas_sp.AAC.1